MLSYGVIKIRFCEPVQNHTCSNVILRAPVFSVIVLTSNWGDMPSQVKCMYIVHQAIFLWNLDTVELYGIHHTIQFGIVRLKHIQMAVSA